MTAIPHDFAPSSADHSEAHAEHAHDELSFFKRYIFSTDHKIIGIEFLFVGLAFMVLGGLLAMLIRWQLGFPGRSVPLLGKFMGWTNGAMPPDFYNIALSMHATFMIFFVVIPLLVGTFGNYLIPLKIGAPDMAFPFLNGFAFWFAVPAGALMLTALILGSFSGNGTAQAGWTVYPPLSAIALEKNGHVEYEKPNTVFASLLQFLRVHDLGGELTPDTMKAETTTVSQKYTGEARNVMTGVRAAAASLESTADGFSGTTESGNSLSIKGKSGATITVTPNASSAGAGTLVATTTEAGIPDARKLLARSATKLKDPAVSGPDLGNPWQTAWNGFSLITNYFSWFLCFMYLCAYQVRLGSRLINIPLSIVLCAVIAYYMLKGVQLAAFDGQSAWFLAIIILGFSSILGAVNYLTTIVKLRCPGMTMFRMPLSVWSLGITSVLVLLATPVLAGVMTMNLLDHHRLTSFFEPFNWVISNKPEDVAGGGVALLHQHLFWFYSHPAVYIMILPAMGMVSDILAVFARKPIFGYRPMVYALAGIAFLGFIVWAHHMFQAGLNPMLGTTFAISTMFIAVPSAIKVFNWLGTLWGGNIRFTTPMWNALAFVSMFIVGGLSGIFMASTAVDVQINQTYFIVAHIHYVLFGGSMFGIFAAITFWYPKMFGRMMNETLGKIHFFITFVAFNCTFFPMHILGIRGMPRRVADPQEYAAFADLLHMNRFITISAMVMGAAQILFAINFIGAWVWGKKAPGNPWEATTLEWNDCPSPPPHGNFVKTPIVHHGPYEYASPLVEEDWLAQTRAVEGTDQFVPHPA
jgi:heme/copper-type cytochrome/quinol oxidase subunit 1